MKHIKVNTSYSPEFKDQLPGQQNAVLVYNTAEHWELSINCLLNDRLTEREVAFIEIAGPGDNKFSGSMQDFMAIRSIAQNALHLTQNLPYTPDIEHLYKDVVEVQNELQHLLSLFK